MRPTRLFVACLLALAALVIVPLAAATTLVSDTFEGETVGATPTGSGYTWGGNCAAPTISNTFAHNGVNSAKIITTGTCSAGGSSLVTTNNLCSTTLDMWILVPAVPGGGGGTVFEMLLDTNPSGYGFPTFIYVDPSGQVHFMISTGVSGADQIVADMFGANTWHEFSITANCATGHFSFSSTDLHPVGGSFPRDYNSQVAPITYYQSSSMNDLRFTYSNSIGGSPVAGYTAYIDDLGDPTTAAATVTITSPTASQTFTTTSIPFASTVSTGTTFSLPVTQVNYHATRAATGDSFDCTGHTSPTYPCNMSMANGAYTVVATGQDVGGGSQTAASASVAFTVNAADASKTHLTAPLNGAALAHGAPVTMSATLTDTGGTVTQLVFYAQGGSVLAQCTDTTSPYSCQVNIPDGTYTATVEGRNSGGSNIAPMDNSPVTFTVGVAAQGPVHVLTLTGKPLTGFDVDISGTNLVARYSASADSHVVTVPAQTIASIQADTDTGCNRVQGVTAGELNVAYTACSPAGASVSSLNIAGASDLGSAQVAAQCTNHAGGAAVWHPGLTGLTGIDTMELGSIDYNIPAVNHGGADCSLSALLGVTDTDGKVGLTVLDLFSDGSQDTSSARVQYVPNGQVAGGMTVCEVSGATTNVVRATPYLLVVDPNQPTKTYKVHDEQAWNSLDLVQTGSGALGGALAVSCTGAASERALLTTTNHIYGYNYIAGSTGWVLGSSVYGPVPHGAAESWDGKWGAVCCLAGTNTIQVYNMATGAAVGNFTMPTFTGSTVVGLVMDSTGQTMWVARTGGGNGEIDEFDIHGSTTVTPVAPGDRTPDPGTGDNNCGSLNCGDNPGGSGGSNNGGGGGVVNTGSALGGLIGAGATVLGAIVVGYGLTANKRRRREEE